MINSQPSLYLLQRLGEDTTTFILSPALEQSLYLVYIPRYSGGSD